MDYQSAKWEVTRRSGGRCEICARLPPGVCEDLKKRFFGQDWVLDYQHIYRRSGFKKLFAFPPNIILGYRFFHRHLDAHIDPITMAKITAEGRLRWYLNLLDPLWRETLLQEVNKLYGEKI